MTKFTKQEAYSGCTRTQGLSKKDVLKKIEELKQYVEDLDEEETWEYITLKSPHCNWCTCNPDGGPSSVQYTWERNGYEYLVTNIGLGIWRRRIA